MDDLSVAQEVARAGAALVRQAIGQRIEARFKSDANPVTEIDEAAERAMLEVLRRLRPEDTVLAEESGGDDWRSQRIWLIDPLDGTVNFIHGIPQVSVSVALWNEGKPLVAVITDVHRHEEFTAVAGEGAHLNGSGTSVSAVADLGQAIVATGFPYDRNVRGRDYARTLGEVLVRVQGVRRFGSAALDLAWVACGRYEGYWESGIQPWDAGAGVLLVAEAGGTVTNGEGGPHRLDDPVIVVSNGLIHTDLLAAVRS